jgi:hypothetical protein
MEIMMDVRILDKVGRIGVWSCNLIGDVEHSK